MYLCIHIYFQHEYDEDESKVRVKRQQQQQRKRPMKKGGDGRRRDGVPSVNGVEKARFNDLKEAVNMSKVSSGTVEYKGVLSRASVVSLLIYYPLLHKHSLSFVKNIRIAVKRSNIFNGSGR